MSAERHQDLVLRAEARVGQLIDGKWKLDKLLGVGGMAAVYAATHRNGKRGAVKILHAHEALDAGMKARFLREGYVANKVGHAGAVSIVDDDEAPDGTVYLVMELLEGETVDARSPLGTTMAPGDVLLLASRLLDILAAAHEKGIVHRDLKPSNLFVTTEGKLKILDFGIARLQERSGDGQPQGTTMSAMGTPGFMPPEQARGRWEEVDARADLWAVGATMFTLLTGKGLHDEGTLNEQLLAAMSKPCPPITTVAPSVSPAIAEIVDRALAFDKANRWPDAASMRAAVDSAYQTVTGRPMSISTHVILTPTMHRSPSLHDPQLASATTLAAPSNPALPAVDQRNTSSPVASSGAMWATKPSARRWVLAVAAAGVTVVAVVVGLGRSSHEPDKTTRVVASEPPPVASPVASTIASAPVPSVTTSAAPPTTPTTPTVVAIHSSRAPVKASASAAPSAAPEVVDIYTRRK